MTARLRKRVSRRASGLAAPECRTLFVPALVRGTAVHYSAGLADARPDHDECPAVWLRWQAMHMGPGGLGVKEGGCDIAYNFGICPHGFTFVGRGWLNRSGANGTSEANARYPAVVVFGGDRVGRRDVTDEARQSLRVCIARQRTLFPWARAIRPHSAFKATGCPGDELRAFITRLLG